ncbi:MAG: orotate phosphoribosyltransferase [Bacteroidales bacterium]|jgi:orotate phosphoribosyltransferase|nr:orotate phosphoribosyltransferase [Bacteroidales bacterium]
MYSTIQTAVTKSLVQINTIKIQPTAPFTWASGWRAPIYCDNRKILSYPAVRSLVRDSFAEIIRDKYSSVEVIAGVATGAIAHGVLVAELLGLPFIYIRSAPKDHGLENLIEGDLQPSRKVVIVEDLVSTGISSLKAAEAVRRAGGDILGMVAIFTYNFPVATDNFAKANIELSTLSNYQALLEVALQAGDIKPSELDSLCKWREDPEHWGKQ